MRHSTSKDGGSHAGAHICLFTACAIWGLMAPLAKDALLHGISGLAMVTFRAVGGAVCFWLASWATRSSEPVSPRHLLHFFFAGLLSIVFNQCCFTVGLSLTSPVNASIITTTLPVVTMVLAALFLKEPVTRLKVSGVLLGALGAWWLIGSGRSAQTGTPAGSPLGDVLCLTAQCCFAIYLTLFKPLIERYSVITCMKWMFTFASLVILPGCFHELQALAWSSVPLRCWGETAFVVVGATFLAYLLMMHGQQTLRPTIVSMYNYVQPIVACIVSVATGLGVFSWPQAVAVVLVFVGVRLVTRSKSRALLETESAASSPNNDSL